MTDAEKGRRRKLVVLAGTAIVAILGATAWFMFRGSGATFSEHPRAKKIALARQDGDVLIRYDRCGSDDLIPYVDAWEVVTDGLHEWEVHNRFWAPDEASWITGRHAVGEASSSEPSKKEYEGSLPPASDIRMDVHVYSASFEDRWHVRVNDLPLRDLPDVAKEPREVMSAEGETMTESEWRVQAKSAC